MGRASAIPSGPPCGCERGSSQPIENSPPGIQTIPSGASSGGEELLGLVGAFADTESVFSDESDVLETSVEFALRKCTKAHTAPAQRSTSATCHIQDGSRRGAGFTGVFGDIFCFFFIDDKTKKSVSRTRYHVFLVMRSSRHTTPLVYSLDSPCFHQQLVV